MVFECNRLFSVTPNPPEPRRVAAMVHTVSVSIEAAHALITAASLSGTEEASSGHTHVPDSVGDERG
jgi:hypothetical protein